MLHLSFQKAKSFLSENGLHFIAEDVCFPSFMTLHVEYLFAEIWERNLTASPLILILEYGQSNTT